MSDQRDAFLVARGLEKSYPTGAGGRLDVLRGVDFEATPLTARIFWHSPEDGEPADVVSVPVQWGEGVWDFLP